LIEKLLAERCPALTLRSELTPIADKRCGKTRQHNITGRVYTEAAIV
jgi:hypothetical protein